MYSPTQVNQTNLILSLSSNISTNYPGISDSEKSNHLIQEMS